VLVKETKELLLPEVTDEWAAEASEFDTVEELTDDLRVRLRQQHVARARVALEQRTADALAELVTEEIPDQLVAAELRERIHDLTHRLESQGMDLGQFLAATGRDERQFVDELRTGALEGVKIDLALRTVVEEEGIEVTDEELDAELVTMGEPGNGRRRGTGAVGTGRQAGGGTLGPAQGQGDALVGRQRGAR
jgi:trigger factor